MDTMRRSFLAGMIAMAAPVSARGWEVCAAAKDASTYAEGDKWAVIADQGKDGWIFSKGELKPPSATLGGDKPLARLSAALARRGISAYVVTMPNRLAIAGGKFDPARPAFAGVDPAKMAEMHHRRVQALNALGLRALDLVDIARDAGLGAGFFRPVDHHWTTQGSLAVAEALARDIRSRPVYASLRKADFDVKTREVNDSGTYFYLMETKCGVLLPSQTTLTYASVRKGADAARSLLQDEPDPDVVLVGTSESRREDFDIKTGAYTEESFPAQLRHALGADVLNAAVEGGGPYVSIEGYLTSDDYRDHPPKVLIWETHDADGLTDAATLRRIAAAAAGPCGKDEALARASGRVEPGKPVDLRAPAGFSVRAASATLALELTDRAVSSFDVSFIGEKGTAEDQAVSRSTLVPRTGRFFVAPAGDDDAPLASVRVAFPPGAGGDYDARLCAPASPQLSTSGR